MAIARRPPKIGPNRQNVDRCLWLLRLAVGIVFLAASIPKIERPFDFLDIIYDYSLVGPAAGVFIAKTVPWLELIVGLCLVTSVLEDGALLFGSLLLVTFAVAEFMVLRHGSRVPCGCFSVDRIAPMNWKDVAMSSGLAAMSIGLLIFRCRPLAAEYGHSMLAGTVVTDGTQALPPQTDVLQGSASAVQDDLRVVAPTAVVPR